MIIIVCHMIWWLLSLEAYYRNGHNLSHVCMSPPVTIAISNQHQPSWPPCQREKHTREDWCPSTADRVHTCQERNMTAVTLTWAQSPVYSQWAAFSSHHFFFPFQKQAHHRQWHLRAIFKKLQPLLVFMLISLMASIWREWKCNIWTLIKICELLNRLF